MYFFATLWPIPRDPEWIISQSCFLVFESKESSIKWFPDPRVPRCLGAVCFMYWRMDLSVGPLSKEISILEKSLRVCGDRGWFDWLVLPRPIGMSLLTWVWICFALALIRGIRLVDLD